MFLSNLNAEIVACILFRKSRHKPNLESSSKYGFSLDLGGKNGGVLSMRMQVILDSSFARPGSAPIRGGKKGEFRDWTICSQEQNSRNIFRKIFLFRNIPNERALNYIGGESGIIGSLLFIIPFNFF